MQPMLTFIKTGFCQVQIHVYGLYRNQFFWGVCLFFVFLSFPLYHFFFLSFFDFLRRKATYQIQFGIASGVEAVAQLKTLFGIFRANWSLLDAVNIVLFCWTKSENCSICVVWDIFKNCIKAVTKQVAQLSQTDRAAGWISFGQKWQTILCRNYRSSFNHCDVIGLRGYRILWNKAT